MIEGTCVSDQRTSVALVTPRPPKADGSGDQRRAQEIADALRDHFDLIVHSWIPDGKRGSLPKSAVGWVRLLRLLILSPVQIALIQATRPAKLSEDIARSAVAIYVTDRAPLGPSLGSNAVMDFVDDLGGVAERRAAEYAGINRAFWLLQSRRLKAYDRKLAATAGVSVAHADTDARRLGEDVLTIPLSPATSPMPDDGAKILFSGNLYYHPNDEAAIWICDQLVPELAKRGIKPDSVVICGRRPGAHLRERARIAGADFRPDVADMVPVIREAAVVLSPMAMGSGSQYKVIDAVGAARATVITPRANEGLNLKDGESAFIRPREPGPFADAIVLLMESSSLRSDFTAAARTALTDWMPESTAAAWRSLVESVAEQSAQPGP